MNYEEEYYKLAAHVERLEEQLGVEVSLRPEWAKGYADESVAAQTYMGAMRQMWEVLGADNQTDAMGKLHRLVNHPERGAWVKLSAPNMDRLKAQWQDEVLEDCADYLLKQGVSVGRMHVQEFAALRRQAEEE